MSIAIKNLFFSYAGSHLPTLNNITLDIQEGEFLGIIGHTGSGKSTFVQLLNALLLPDSGKVSVDGMDTKDKTLRKKIRSLVGMVFQYPEYQLFADTVKEDIAFGPANRGDSPDAVDLAVRKAMEMCNLDYELFANKSPFELSGGEKRRVALAGILALQPKYIVLDEPMAGLDPRGRKEILEMLEHLRCVTGCAIIMVSHSMDDMAAHADRILVLENGSVRFLDTPKKVFMHSAELVSMGLCVPEVSRLAMLLREKGVKNIPDICTFEDMLLFLKGRLGR